AAEAYQDRTLRNLKCRRIQCDEIWSFVYAKTKNVPQDHAGEFGYGDVWTWVAIDAETKLVPSWAVGRRDGFTAQAFIRDLGDRQPRPRPYQHVVCRAPELDDANEHAAVHSANQRILQEDREP